MSRVEGKRPQTAGPDECTLMTEEHPVGIVGCFCFLHAPPLDDIPIDDIGILWTPEHPSEGIVRCKGVSSIHEDHPLTLRHPHPFVHGIIDALVWFGDPSGDGCLMSLDHLHGLVCGGPVDDEVFLVLPGLAFHTLYGSFQQLGVIAADGDDGDGYLVHKLSLMGNLLDKGTGIVIVVIGLPVVQIIEVMLPAVLMGRDGHIVAVGIGQVGVGLLYTHQFLSLE